MDRKYTAFISYRHLPLDKAVAAKLQHKLEAYVIPRALRRDGQKRLGLVFRDVEELPLTSSLTDDIHLALDHSDFLIVICSPQLLESRYCMDEVDYFLKNHDLCRVLTVLVAGTPNTSFPPALFNAHDALTDEDRPVEPLAANVVSDSIPGSLKLLDREFLRIVAAMLGCPYDALVQRQRHARRVRRTLAAATALAVLAVYSGTLLIKNRQISAQLRQTQINESEALAYESGQLLEQGYGVQALETALKALPGDGEDRDRPVVPAAVNALADALHVYENGAYVAQARVDQDSRVSRALLSPDGSVLVTYSEDLDIHAYRADDGAPLWATSYDEAFAGIAPAGDYIVCSPWFDEQTVQVMDYDGGIVAELENGSYIPAEGNRDRFFIDHGDRIACYDARTCAAVGSFTWEPSTRYVRNIGACCVSQDGRYCAFLRGEDYQLYDVNERDNSLEVRLVRLDAGEAACGEAVFRLHAPNVLAALAPLGESGFALFCAEGVYRLEPGMKEPERVAQYGVPVDFSRALRVLHSPEKLVCMASNACFEVDASTGALLWEASCEYSGGVLLAFWQDAAQTTVRWVTEGGELRGFMDRRFDGLSVEGEPAHARALLETQRLGHTWSHGGVAGGTADRLVLCPTQALQSAWVLRYAMDENARALSDSYDGMYTVWPWATGEGSFYISRIGDVTALDGGRAFVRMAGVEGLKGFAGQADLYQVTADPPNADAVDANNAVPTIRTRVRPLSLSEDGTRLMTGRAGAWTLLDGAWVADPEHPGDVDVFSEGEKRFYAPRYGDRPLCEVCARQTQDGGIDVEIWQDGRFAWRERLPEPCRFYEAEDPDYYIPQANQMGLNGWLAMEVSDPQGGGVWLACVDTADRKMAILDGFTAPYCMDVGNARQKPLAFVLQTDGTAMLLNCATGECVASYPFPFDLASVLEVRFVLDDRALLVHQRSNRITLLEPDTGERLFSWMPDTSYAMLAECSAEWSGDALYLSMDTEDEQQYLGGVRIDARNWSLDLELTYLDQYLPALDSVICYAPTRTRQYLVPVYSVEALIEKGRARLKAMVGAAP